MQYVYKQVNEMWGDKKLQYHPTSELHLLRPVLHISTGITIQPFTTH